MLRLTRAADLVQRKWKSRIECYALLLFLPKSIVHSACTMCDELELINQVAKL